MTTNEKKNKHMTIDDRVEIQECLYKGMTFKTIAKRIGKDPTTVSKEVKLHGMTYKSGHTRTDECCPKLLKAPFVCNGCEKQSRGDCRFPRRKYAAKAAQQEYERILREAREGIPLTKEAFYSHEEILSNAVRAGQSVYHAIIAHNIPVSKTTAYRHIKNGYYSISNLDLPRAVKFKPRAPKHSDYVPKGVKNGRSFDDFVRFLAEDPSCNYIEMDTLIGAVGGKVVMTLHFVNVDFMIGILLNNKTAVEAGSKIQALKEKLSEKGVSFGKIFPILLTDNGGEFADVFAFENNPAGEPETRVFYCDPNAPYQKPHVENNHTLFRAIVPKGNSFDSFSQSTVDLIFSHVNGIKRKQFNGKSAYEMFSFAYSAELAAALGISYVDPKAVIQNRKLLLK